MQPVRVLMLDFHPGYRQAVQHSLGDYPTDVEVVEPDIDVAVGIAAINLLRPDVILFSDRIDLSLITHLRDQQSDCCIVLSTSYVAPELVHRAFQLGAIGYVLQACGGEDLIQAIKHFHSREATSAAKRNNHPYAPQLWGDKQ